jgi:hypothetical protein
MFKYFEKYSSSYKTTIYYCQIDGWNYCCAEYRVARNYDKTWAGSFYDFIEIDWKEWKKNEKLPKELKALPQDVMYKMIEYVI